MTYLETLTKQAIRASIQPGGKLRLEPGWLITDDIRRMVREHRGELVSEIMALSASRSDRAAKLGHKLAALGYACIRSAVIDDIVVFVRDDSVAVPARWACKVRFTMGELILMVGSAPEMVKQMHEVKRVFGGMVVPVDDYPFGGTISTTTPAAASTIQQLSLTS
ncbi:MAG: hypothetical protein ACYC64_10370 [Armatimonadota bacterium]